MTLVLEDRPPFPRHHLLCTLSITSILRSVSSSHWPEPEVCPPYRACFSLSRRCTGVSLCCADPLSSIGRSPHILNIDCKNHLALQPTISLTANVSLNACAVHNPRLYTDSQDMYLSGRASIFFLSDAIKRSHFHSPFAHLPLCTSHRHVSPITNHYGWRGRGPSRNLANCKLESGRRQRRQSDADYHVVENDENSDIGSDIGVCAYAIMHRLWFQIFHRSSQTSSLTSSQRYAVEKLFTNETKLTRS
jgi:hypothetical protein